MKSYIIGMLYAENDIKCMKHDPKNANQNFEKFSFYSWNLNIFLNLLICYLQFIIHCDFICDTSCIKNKLILLEMMDGMFEYYNTYDKIAIIFCS